MKHAIYGNLLFVITLFMILILAMANTNTIKLQELNRVANISINNLGVYLVNSNIDNSFSYDEVKQLISEDIEGISSTGELSASILVCDEDNKIIKVHYVLEWVQFNEVVKSYELTRTIMLDEEL